jgi:streptogramin lyase
MSLLSKSIVAALSALVLAAPALAQPFPEVIPLPTGFQPEGIAAGRGSTFFVGSIPTGAVFRGDLRTGDGDVIVPGREGRSSIGIKVDGKDRLFVAGGDTGRAFVYDATTGARLADYLLAPSQPTFVNDVVLTRDAAWFTDSFRAVLYRVPFGPGGSLPGASDVAELP